MEQAAKMKRFEKAIFEEINSKISDMTEELETKRTTALKENEEKNIAKAYREIQKGSREIRKKYQREVASFSLASKRKLILKRNELTGLIFDTVAARLTAFCVGDEYKKYLLESMKGFIAANHVDSVTVYVSERDMAMEKEIAALFGKNAVIASRKDIRLGGFIVEDLENGIYFDETLEEKLEARKSEFAKQSEFSLD